MHLDSTVATCHVTTLTVAPGRSRKTGKPYSVRKTINAAGDTVEGYNAGYKFKFTRTPVSSWREAQPQLDGLANDDRRMLVMGEPLQWPMSGMHRRTLNDRPNSPATLRKGKSILLPLDLDGAQPPGYESLDPVADPEGCVVACLRLLPKEFHNATVWWTFTSSQKLAPIPGLRLRLVFLLNTPWHLNEMKRWTAALDVRLHADGSMLSGNQPIYLARPAVEGGGADPIQRRYGLRRGAVDLVHASLPPVPVQTWAAVGGGGGGGAGVYLPRGANPLDLIGDHDGGAGCYQGLLHATFYMVRDSEDSDDISHKLSDADIKCLVRERALAADWLDAKHTPAYVRQQLTDAKLDSMIRGAREKLKSQQALLMGVAPEYPAAPMDYDTAVAALDEGITDAVGQAVAGPDGPTLIQAPAGLGKTTQALKQVIAARLDVVNVYVPSHKLAEELAAKVAHMGGRAEVMRGRTRSDGDPDFPMDMCAKAPLVEALVKQGITQVQGLLCVRKVGITAVKCSSFGHCGYSRQFQTSAPIRIYTHASIALDRNIFERDAPPADMSIVDESPLQSLIEQCSWPLADARAAGGLVAEIAEIVVANLPLLEELRVRHDDAVEALDETLEGLIRPALGITPEHSVDSALQILARKNGPMKANFGPLLECVRAALMSGESHFNGVWLGADADRMESIYMARRRRPVRLEGGDAGKVLLLDATPNVAAWQTVLPHLTHQLITVERNALVVQVYDSAVSKTRLAKDDLVRDLVGVVDGAARQYGSVGVCAPKMLTDRMAEDLKEGVADGSVMLANFGGLRGLDTLKDTAVGVIIGRNQPPAFEVERLARAIWPYEGMALTGEYIERPVGYRMRNGQQVGTVVHDHADPRVRSVLRQMREAESEQALDRHRLVHRAEPKLIVLMSKLPLDLDVDRLVKLRDVVGYAGLFAALNKFDGVLPLGAEWLSANVDALGGLAAAEHWARRAGITATLLKAARRRNNRHFLYISCEDVAVIPLPHRQVSYRLQGERGRPRRALTTQRALADVLRLLAQHHDVEQSQVVGARWADAEPRSTLLTEGFPLSPIVNRRPGFSGLAYCGTTLLTATSGGTQ